MVCDHDLVDPVISDNGMRICQAGPDIVRYQGRVIGENIRRLLALREQRQDHFDRHPHATDDWLSPKYGGVSCNTIKQAHGLVPYCVC